MREELYALYSLNAHAASSISEIMRHTDDVTRRKVALLEKRIDFRKLDAEMNGFSGGFET
jgi:hypothetical protein